MFFRQCAAANATLSYLFGCAGHQMAVAVDVVAGDDDWFITEAEKAGARIVHVIDTHVHADHYSGGPELALRVGAPYGLEIYPGHQAGSACGAGLSGKPASTIGFERRFNPQLSMAREAFVEALVADIPAPPADMDAIVRFNLGQAH